MQIKYIKSRLIAMDKLKITPANDHLVNMFVKNYLRRDGIFLIRLVGKNASDLIAAELVCGLFEHYKDNKKSIERLQSKDSGELRMLNRLLTKDGTVDLTSNMGQGI